MEKNLRRCRVETPTVTWEGVVAWPVDRPYKAVTLFNAFSLHVADGVCYESAVYHEVVVHDARTVNALDP